MGTVKVLYGGRVLLTWIHSRFHYRYSCRHGLGIQGSYVWFGSASCLAFQCLSSWWSTAYLVTVAEQADPWSKWRQLHNSHSRKTSGIQSISLTGTDLRLWRELAPSSVEDQGMLGGFEFRDFQLITVLLKQLLSPSNLFIETICSGLQVCTVCWRCLRRLGSKAKFAWC